MEYQEYLASPEWKAKREWALERAGNRCQVCNYGCNLQVHHRTYENLGHELPGDLTVLCGSCHQTFHAATSAEPGSVPCAGGGIESLKKVADAVRRRGAA